MPDLFISYSRKDKEFVHRLDEALKSRGREAWVDWDDIRPTEEFMQAIYAAIEDADAFVFVLTPDSVASAACGRVPIVARDVKVNTVPKALAKLDWIFYRHSDNFEKATDRLISAFESNIKWVHVAPSHRRSMSYRTEAPQRRIQVTSENRSMRYPRAIPSCDIDSGNHVE